MFSKGRIDSRGNNGTIEAMKTLREYIAEAEAQKIAIGHFNISDSSTLKGILEAAQEVSKERRSTQMNTPIYADEKIPIIIGVSEGERSFVGVGEVAAMVREFRNEFDYPVFLNADHTRAKEKILEAVRHGFDAVLFDAGAAELGANIRATKDVVEAAKAANPAVLVEGELGFIGTSSVILNEIPKGAAIEEKDLTTPEDAARFVRETGVDLIGPAVGNIHGMFKNAPNPRLNIARIKAIREASGVPIVLHGGSGIADEDFRAAIAAGISIIHINTELRVAWKKGIVESLAHNPDEVVPYKLLAESVADVQAVVAERLKLFSNLL